MQVALTTTVRTIIDLTAGATLDQARSEIFDRFMGYLDDEDATEGLVSLQDRSVLFDEVVGTETSHTFGEPVPDIGGRLLADLTDAAAQLRKYETLHRAKNTPDSLEKADVNAALAARFEATIAAAVGGAE